MEPFLTTRGPPRAYPQRNVSDLIRTSVSAAVTLAGVNNLASADVKAIFIALSVLTSPSRSRCTEGQIARVRTRRRDQRGVVGVPQPLVNSSRLTDRRASQRTTLHTVAFRAMLKKRKSTK